MTVATQGNTRGAKALKTWNAGEIWLVRGIPKTVKDLQPADSYTVTGHLAKQNTVASPGLCGVEVSDAVHPEVVVVMRDIRRVARDAGANLIVRGHVVAPRRGACIMVEIKPERMIRRIDIGDLELASMRDCAVNKRDQVARAWAGSPVAATQP